MTRNQIDYLKLVETQRANAVQEDLTRIRDQANIEIGRGQLEESKRHNLAQEQYQMGSLQELSRHNQATELLGTQQLQESSRHNLATELEATRHNTAAENEMYRSNLARETETHRANVQSENLRQMELSEQQRYHNMSISLGYSNVQLGYAQLSEQQRANQAREAETHRSNVQHEMLTSQQIAETTRANQAREQETNRSNVSREAELHRSNTVNESIQVANTVIRGVDVAANVIGKIANTAAMILTGI